MLGTDDLVQADQPAADQEAGVRHPAVSPARAAGGRAPRAQERLPLGHGLAGGTIRQKPSI